MHRVGLRTAVSALVLALAALIASPSHLLAEPSTSTPLDRQARRATVSTPTASVPQINYSERVLANGMRIYTSLDRSTPNVTVQVWYGVGSRDDPAGRSGFAHLFEHMMFKATRDMPAETMDRLTEDVGGFNNASTWDDFTNYYEVIPANHLQRLLWAESQRLSSLVIDAPNFSSERDVVKEELRQRILADPYGRLFDFVLSQSAWQVHPYRRTTIGSIENLDAASLDDVRAFHATYYRPDNAALFIVGNFDEAQLNRWVDQYFGPLARPATAIPRVTAVEPPRTQAQHTTFYAPNVPLPAVLINWPAPPASHRDAAALEVLDGIMTTGQSSRLYNGLVYEQQISAQIFSDADLRQQPGLFYVGSIMSSGHTVQEGEAALRAQITRVRDTPVTAAELNEAKTELIASAVRSRETIDGRAEALGMALMIEGDAGRANSHIAELQAVTVADIQRVARTYLSDNQAVVIHYLDEGTRPAGQAAQVATADPATASTPFSGAVATLAPEGQRQAPPPVGAPLQATLPRPVERTLANGLRVIVAQSSTLPLVTAQLTFRAGGSVDPANLAGAANMTAALVTQGTTTRTAQQIASQTEALGADLSAGSGWEASTVTLNVMSNNLRPAMSIMADVTQRPLFAAAELDRVRTETLDGLTVALQSPGSIASFAGSPVLWGGSAYGHVAAGTQTSLPRLSAADLRALHSRYWRPDNGILVLTGNITPEAGFALAQSAFGGWTRPRSPLPPPPATPQSRSPRAIAIDLPGAGQAAVLLLGPAVSRSDPRYYPGLVATTVLGGGYSARMNYEIRIRRGLSYGASASLTARRSVGSYIASAQTRNDAAAQVVGLVQTELGRMSANAPDAAELAARRSSLVGDFGRDIGATSSLAEILSNLALFGVNLNELEVYQARVEGVTPAQVADYARDVLSPGRASIIVVGDGAHFLTALRSALPNLEVIPISELNLDSPSLRRAPTAPTPTPTPAP